MHASSHKIEAGKKRDENYKHQSVNIRHKKVNNMEFLSLKLIYVFINIYTTVRYSYDLAKKSFMYVGFFLTVQHACMLCMYVYG